MPLIAIPMSYLLLSEKASHKEWAGAAVGFVGVLVYSFVVFENRSLSAFGAVLTLLDAFFWAMYTIYYRKLKNQEPTMKGATQLSFGALLFFLITPLGFRVSMSTATAMRRRAANRAGGAQKYVCQKSRTS
jgi:drug/metabolite transporter (DMT)-like permease